MLLLTVARYYTPLGRLIQRPFTDDVRAYVQEGYDDVDPNAVDSLRSSKAKFTTSAGRVVYGGGGIIPDRVLARAQNPKSRGRFSAVARYSISLLPGLADATTGRPASGHS